MTVCQKYVYIFLLSFFSIWICVLHIYLLINLLFFNVTAWRVWTSLALSSTHGSYQRTRPLKHSISCLQNTLFTNLFNIYSIDAFHYAQKTFLTLNHINIKSATVKIFASSNHERRTSMWFLILRITKTYILYTKNIDQPHWHRCYPTLSAKSG